jgi:LPXTG-motif cell wall-anchored protein
MKTALVLMQAPASPPAKANAGEVMVWVAVLMGLILVGGLLVLLLRRRLLAAEAETSAGGLMEDLRRMRDSGQMTQEEYESVRRNMAARLAKDGFGSPKRSGGSESR